MPAFINWGFPEFWRGSRSAPFPRLSAHILRGAENRCAWSGRAASCRKAPAESGRFFLLLYQVCTPSFSLLYYRLNLEATRSTSFPYNVLGRWAFMLFSHIHASYYIGLFFIIKMSGKVCIRPSSLNRKRQQILTIIQQYNILLPTKNQAMPL